jgi:hypothetical protein
MRAQRVKYQELADESKHQLKDEDLYHVKQFESNLRTEREKQETFNRLEKERIKIEL